MTISNIKTHIADLPDKERLELISFLAESLDGSVPLNQLIFFIAAHWGKGDSSMKMLSASLIDVPDELIKQAEEDFPYLLNGKIQGTSGEDVKNWIRVTHTAKHLPDLT